MDDNDNEERRPTNTIMAALTPGTHTSIGEITVRNVIPTCYGRFGLRRNP
jgi:hypothetical protein